jgi:hypothetical protein
MDHTYIEVPGPDARWWTEINEFALTYNAYNRNGDIDFVAGIDKQVREAWDQDATLPDDLSTTTIVSSGQSLDRFVTLVVGESSAQQTSCRKPRTQH